eukprot:1017681_1
MAQIEQQVDKKEENEDTYEAISPVMEWIKKEFEIKMVTVDEVEYEQLKANDPEDPAFAINNLDELMINSAINNIGDEWIDEELKEVHLTEIMKPELQQKGFGLERVMQESKSINYVEYIKERKKATQKEAEEQANNEAIYSNIMMADVISKGEDIDGSYDLIEQQQELKQVIDGMRLNNKVREQNLNCEFKMGKERNNYEEELTEILNRSYEAQQFDCITNNSYDAMMIRMRSVFGDEFLKDTNVNLEQMLKIRDEFMERKMKDDKGFGGGVQSRCIDPSRTMDSTEVFKEINVQTRSMYKKAEEEKEIQFEADKIETKDRQLKQILIAIGKAQYEFMPNVIKYAKTKNARYKQKGMRRWYDADYFMMIDKGTAMIDKGLLKYEGKLIVPQEYTLELIYNCHIGINKMHLPASKVLKQMQSIYHWCGMSDDIKNTIDSCICAPVREKKKAALGFVKKGETNYYVVSAPNELVFMDIIGPVAGKSDIVLTAIGVIKIIFICWILVWGLFKKLIKDNASNFNSKINKLFYWLFGIEFEDRLVIASPWGNWPTELRNKKFKEGMDIEVARRKMLCVDGIYNKVSALKKNLSLFDIMVLAKSMEAYHNNKEDHKFGIKPIRLRTLMSNSFIDYAWNLKEATRIPVESYTDIGGNVDAVKLRQVLSELEKQCTKEVMESHAKAHRLKQAANAKIAVEESGEAIAIGDYVKFKLRGEISIGWIVQDIEWKHGTKPLYFIRNLITGKERKGVNQGHVKLYSKPHQIAHAQNIKNDSPITRILDEDRANTKQLMVLQKEEEEDMKSLHDMERLKTKKLIEKLGNDIANEIDLMERILIEANQIQVTPANTSSHYVGFTLNGYGIPISIEAFLKENKRRQIQLASVVYEILRSTHGILKRMKKMYSVAIKGMKKSEYMRALASEIGSAHYQLEARMYELNFEMLKKRKQQALIRPKELVKEMMIIVRNLTKYIEKK